MSVKNPHIKKCVICDIDFDYGKHKQKLTCSKECCKQHNLLNNENRKEKIKLSWEKKNGTKIKKCVTCNNDFNYGRHNEKLNCSKECLRIYNDIHKNERMKKTFDAIESKYGVRAFSLTEDFDKKVKKTKKEKYGDENYNNFEKIKETNKQKYGVDSPLELLSTHKKSKQTKQTSYGDENFNNREKAKTTIKEKYGVDHHLQIPFILNKQIKTNNLKYNADNPLLLKSSRQKLLENNLKKYNAPNYLTSDEHRKKTKENKLKDLRNILDLQNIFFDFELYNGVYDISNGRDKRKKILYKFFCNICNNEFVSSLYPSPICHFCNPKDSICIQQSEFKQFLKEQKIKFIEDSKKIIPPFQIDFLLSENNIGVELNGNYFHSEFGGDKDKNYHLNKSQICFEKNIKLIHVFEDEWKFKTEIVKSRISSIIGNVNKKYFARKCEIKIIDYALKNKFLNENHLQGADNSFYNIGLFHKDELISVMTFSKPRIALGQKKLKSEDAIVELSRFCSLININVVGGFNKMLQFFIKNNCNIKKIYTYADCRWSGLDPKQTVYFKSGFNFIKKTKPSYFYMFKKDYFKRYHRFAFNKQKLIKLFKEPDILLTEWQIAQKNGLDRIWDCGTMKFELNII